MTQRICPECDGDMHMRRADAIYCSTRCRVAAHRRPSVPVELARRPRWVRRNHAKLPMMVNARVASVSDPSTWASYAAVKRSEVGAGLGFVLNGDGIGCIDLDSCVSGGVIAGWAQEILDANPGTFTELSPSGTGLHIWGLLDSAPGRRVRDGRNIEVYSQGRYIALGTQLPGSPLRLEPLILPSL